MAANPQDAYRLFAGPLLSMAERNRAMFERTLRAAQEESLHVINQGLKRNARALEGLRDCRKLSDMMQVEQELFSCAISDSLEETQRLTKLWWQLAEDGLQTIEAEAVFPANGAHAGAKPDSEPHQKPARARAAA